MPLTKSLAFLSLLKDHNNRDWFHDHEDRYREARREFEDFIASLIVRGLMVDPSIGALTVKDAVFRIYRDIRFSHDKTPYKTVFSAHIAKGGGRKSRYAGYYIHIEPQGSFMSGGIYMPDPADLKAVRKELHYNFVPFRKIIEDSEFKKVYGEIAGDKLKKIPSGFDPDHPAAEYIKHKNLYVFHSFTDEEVLSDDLTEKIIANMKILKPFDDYLNEALD